MCYTSLLGLLAVLESHLYTLIPQLRKRCPDACKQLLPVLSASNSCCHLLLEACAVSVQQPVHVQDLRLRQPVLVLERLRTKGTHQHMLLKLWADVLDGLQVPITQPRGEGLFSSPQQVLQEQRVAFGGRWCG